MKGFLITVASILIFTQGAFAQVLPPDFYWEVGFNAGYTEMTRPVGPTDSYTGTRTKVVPDYSFRLDYFITPNWMVNLDINENKLESYGNWGETGTFGQQLPYHAVSFLEAAYCYTENVGINYVIPFSTRYNTFTRANLNFGATVGLVTTVNDANTAYKNYKTSPDSGQVYVSQYNYAAGLGYSYGVQMGFTYYILPRFAVNIDLAMRYMHVKTDDVDYRAENDKFNLLYFPETVGLRWRF